MTLKTVGAGPELIEMVRCGEPACRGSLKTNPDGSQQCLECNKIYAGFGVGSLKPQKMYADTDLSPADRSRLLDNLRGQMDEIFLEIWKQEKKPGTFLVDIRPVLRKIFSPENEKPETKTLRVFSPPVVQEKKQGVLARLLR